MNRYKASIPNALCVARILLTPILFVFALQGRERAFLFLVYFIIFTDFIDGPLARAWRVESLRGQWLDGWADTFFYAVAYGLAIYLVADEALNYWVLVFLPPLLFVLLPPAAHILTGRMRCMHLWSKRVISYPFIPWITLTVLDQFNLALLIIINLMTLLAFVEEVSIYYLARDGVDETITSILQLKRSRAQTA